MLPLKLEPTSWEPALALRVKQQSEGWHFCATLWLRRYRIIHTRFQRVSGNKARRRESEKSAQSSALPTKTLHWMPRGKPQLCSWTRHPGKDSPTDLLRTLAGRRQLGLMKNGSCDIWVFAETDVFSQEAFFCPALKLIFSWILYTVPLLLCIHWKYLQRHQN